ncbi:2-iminoacetate synthase ThiH [Marinifilum sp. D737]|uniref:2-iminoacetate synthase ThiH n=1 Tax=Marinifilum sp. D737 TaxID=2969628 RepID=UPI002276BCE7|nr:2-iminoacetate synthase ThiH [Marinifilum sp. D737]MCY1636099.1 2-iminoacetate synthase ThiH [Marinifilum sp. D737]
MSFYNEIQKYNWDEVKNQIYSKTEADVKHALEKEKIDLNDFQALISPAASAYLETMAQKSMQLTQKRFGKCIQMYIPLYISNSCTNTCVYCGFNHKNKFDRKILKSEEMRQEAKEIKKLGFEHILLVSGEDQKNCGCDYIGEMMDSIKDQFSLISLEAQPLSTDEYKKLTHKGLNTVYIYQETYNELNYKKYHPAGKKSNYQYRLETPDRLGQAGVHKVGLGCLLGLEDWRVDTFFTALHLQYLERNYWKSKYSISFPRLRPHAGGFQPNYETTQKDLVQLITAYRLFNHHVEISLSTRESEKFRDNMLQLGATSFSAGSKTNPGGYSNKEESLEQFSINDDRSPSEIAEMIQSKGYEVVWKDWDNFMQL